jgi:antitoxin HicB
MRYPVTLTRDTNNTVLVTFPDVSEAVTYGDTIEEALKRAPDALLTIFDALMKDRRDIPTPSVEGERFVALPALETVKIILYQTMRANRVNKAELAKRLDWYPPQVDRVLNVRHGSQLDQVEAALGALGKQLVLSVLDAPPPQATRVPRPRGVHAGVLVAAKARGADTGRRVYRGVKRASKKR